MASFSLVEPASGTIISDCGAYRYRLERMSSTDTGPLVCFIGVNPSTADASRDDATVRKWRGFAKVLGARGFVVGNLFAFRATDVGALRAAADAKGPDNDYHLIGMMRQADIVVPCWGSRAKLPRELWGRIGDVRGLIRHCGKPIQILGFTSTGDPKHPLMLGYGTRFRGWDDV